MTETYEEKEPGHFLVAKREKSGTETITLRKVEYNFKQKKVVGKFTSMHPLFKRVVEKHFKGFRTKMKNEKEMLSRI